MNLYGHLLHFQWLLGKDNPDSGGSDAESTASNSLDRKSTASASFEQFRKSQKSSSSNVSMMINTDSIDSRVSGSSKRSSWAGGGGSMVYANSSEDIGAQFGNFAPVTLTVSSFFKQVRNGHNTSFYILINFFFWFIVWSLDRRRKCVIFLH